MTDLDRIKNWLMTFSKMSDALDLQVDYFDERPESSSISPSGLVEINRKEDILGNIIVKNQYNFALYFAFPKAPGDDVGAAQNADWLLDFQRWVQEQSIRRLVPIFGDDPKTETIKAQNGEITYAGHEGIGLYTVLLSIEFTKKYEVN